MLPDEVTSIVITVMIAMYLLGLISGWVLNEATQPQPVEDEDDDLDLEEFDRLLK